MLASKWWMVLALWAAFTGNACAQQAAAIGEADVRELTRVITAQEHRRWTTAQFNAEIAKARAEFFALAERGTAQQRHFPELLAVKDASYLMPLLAHGTADLYSRARNEAFAFVDGGQLDDGIPRPARAALDRWVEAVRGSLGATNETEFVPIVDAARLSRALADNMSFFRAYKARRDKFEFERAAAAERVQASRASGGGLRLHAQRVTAFAPVRDLRRGLAARAQPLRSLADSVARRGQRVLRCEYGPLDLWADGTPRYRTHLWWHRRAPANLVALKTADPSGTLGVLASATAYASCPDPEPLPAETPVARTDAAPRGLSLSAAQQP